MWRIKTIEQSYRQVAQAAFAPTNHSAAGCAGPRQKGLVRLFFFCRRGPSPIHLFAEVFKPKDGTSRLNRVPPTFLKPKGPPRSQLLHRNCRHVFPFLLPSSCPFPRPIQSSKQRRTKALSTGASDLAGSLDYVLKYLLSTYLGRYLSRYQRKAVGSFDFDTRIFGAWN
jgi:hypothetical protein